jgi:PAT family beta-lactamase induction signal transducer AmpG
MKKLARLLALYFAQGLPFGFQASALPLILRERGVSLQTIGFASFLAAPWLAKPLWAPLVDRYASARFGRRKSWIVPMQIGLALSAFAAARTHSSLHLAALILLMNLFAATQDIAVDALAVAALEPAELGPGNAVQVVGYKLGMLTGGGLLVWASGTIGWAAVFYAMAALMLVVLVVALTMPEADGGEANAAQVDFGELSKRLRQALRQPSTAALIALVMTYKTGETLADAMWKPLLFDRGFSAAQIGLWSGTFGLLFSLAGSSGAGIWARRVELPRALLWAASARALGVAAEWWLSLHSQPTAASVIAVTCLEHLLGGAITTLMFALMMGHTERAIGATHYTLLASLEVWGKLPLAALSGVLATLLGYPGLFALATGLCLAFTGLVLALRPRLTASAPRSFAAS